MEGLKGYWKRKDYERLDGSGRRGKKKHQIELGRTRRRRFWRIKITPKLRMFRLSSPKKFLIRIRDAYVKMMLGFANSAALNGGFAYSADVDSRVLGFGRPALKEYDEKVIVEIYKSLMVQRQLMGDREGMKVGEVACAR
ncbi:uncharacterized protein LOC131225641 [Magnolia sinica]|uniref:uncharacterized protein LOC131225641 n=1 Tax=Magnolia sinica TaxID=86752 RepID=UPI00265AF435|nr:uncharacterized protein LOC131225641 [Magnolia sinica]